jgi:RHS repeat-associated protein
MGRVTSRVDPLGRSESYVYDALGNVTSWADRNGQLTTVAYDALERPASVTYADGSSTTFQWDAGNRLAQAVDSAAGAITRVWDRHDRLVSESTPAATVAYTYDAAGRRTSMTANGVPTTYEYDAASRVTRISTAAATVDIAYDAAGRRSRLDLPNGVAVEHAYDMASRLTRLTYRLGETVLGALTYRYDAAGNRVRVGGSWARIGMPEPLAAASYDDANRPLAFGARILTHDPAGHLTSDGENAYQWNARHQLVAVDGPGLALRYAYDALGRRRSREAGGVSTSFVYDGIQAVAEAGAVPVALLAGLGVDEHLAFMDPGGRRVPLTDAIGSVIAVSDDEGALTVQHTYTPFGLSGSAGDGDSHRLLFAGREWEHSGGLHFNRSRYYHAVLQRFLSEDPIGFAAADANLYAYARNNPLGLNDPLGLEAHVATYPNAVGTVGAGIFPMATASIHAVPPRPGVPRAFGPPTMLGHDAVSVARMIAIPTSPELERALQAAVDIAAPRGRCRADARSGAPGTTGTAGPSVPWAWMPAHPLLTPATAVERAPRPTPWAWLDVSAPGQPPYVTRAR